jgi:CRISPR-associated protein Cmr2
MSHLLAITVGPVQEFIAAARRTRDLWFGSHLLSEISREVAKAVERQGGHLIFPASSDAENVANVILAELPTGEPKNVAAAAKQAAKDCWKKFAEQARADAGNAVRADIWNEQVDDVIELYAAWLGATDNYAEDRKKLMRLLAGRKNCRDFLPAKGRAGVPKSSLDGQRESVLKPPREWQERFRTRLRSREGEQLDVVGVVKRVAGSNQPYPSVARIAADPWVRGNQHRLAPINAACEQLRSQGIIRGLDKTTYPQFAVFPYEGTAVYTSRHHELIEETEATIDQLRPLGEALTRLAQPEPYLSVLVADGDRMGAAISDLTAAVAHREFSQALAGFAGEARQIVKAHNGVLVYAGGDDVLAFLPVDRCLECARKLHDKFSGLLSKYGSLTLSVGIAIGHFMENLEDLLGYGRTAEKAAKEPDRDGLAVHLHKRGGAPIRARAKWSERPDERLSRYAELILAEAIPSKLPYDLRKLADVYQDWPTDTMPQALRQDVLRVICDKQPRSGRLHIPELARILQTVTNASALHRFAEELLVARQLATALRQAGERPTQAQEAAL